MLYRMAKPNGDFLGRVRVTTVTGGESRNLYKPLDRKNTVNPKLRLESPHPGVFIFAFNSDFIYPNVNHYIDKMVWHVLDNTRSGTPNKYARLGDRPWNDPKPRANETNEAYPTLKAIIYDMTAVSNVDVTSVQVFVDVKKQLDRHAAPHNVYFHFAGIRSPWTRRALASVGFGDAEGPRPVFSVADTSAGEVKNEKREGTPDIETTKQFIPVTSLDRPTFNIDLDEALEMALINIGAKEPQRRPSFDDRDRKTPYPPYERSPVAPGQAAFDLKERDGSSGSLERES
jgi:sodium-independent sulfate anion transporter 11